MNGGNNNIETSKKTNMERLRVCCQSETWTEYKLFRRLSRSKYYITTIHVLVNQSLVSWADIVVYGHTGVVTDTKCVIPASYPPPCILSRVSMVTYRLNVRCCHWLPSSHSVTGYVCVAENVPLCGDLAQSTLAQRQFHEPILVMLPVQHDMKCLNAFDSKTLTKVSGNSLFALVHSLVIDSVLPL